MKKTKQGVRDLNSLPSTPAGRRLEDPPIVIMCKHPSKRFTSLGTTHCNDCDACWDYDGRLMSET